MSMTLNFDVLLDYTDWERQKWREWFQQRGDQALEVSAGPRGDGRFEMVGDLVRHIFSAEKRYIERLGARPLTDTASLPNRNAKALFHFGDQSRKELREFLTANPADDWDRPQDFKILNYEIAATPRKIVVHVLMHEIRHWAQIATLLRLNGLPVEWRDFLFSPVLSSAVEHAQKQHS